MSRFWSMTLVFFLLLTGLAMAGVGHLLARRGRAAAPPVIAGPPSSPLPVPDRMAPQPVRVVDGAALVPVSTPADAGQVTAVMNPFEDTLVVLPGRGTWLIQGADAGASLVTVPGAPAVR